MGMDTPLPFPVPMTPLDHPLTAILQRERHRLQRFIRRQIPNPSDVDDLLQEIWCELIAAYRLPEPIEQVGAWLYQVARHRIIDRFRKRKEESLEDLIGEDEDGELESVWLSVEAGPEATYTRALLWDALAAALEELPAAQREVFIAHELEGRSFKALAAESGVAVNTLLSRKHEAVRRLCARLQTLYDELWS